MRHKILLATVNWNRPATPREQVGDLAGIGELRDAAAARAASRGHEFGPWGTVGGKDVAKCGRCGAEVEIAETVLSAIGRSAVRSNGGLLAEGKAGRTIYAIGPALADECDAGD